MRIAFVHNFYRSASPSGENLVVNAQIELLRNAGHDVVLVSQASDDRRWSVLQRLSAGVRVMRWKGVDPAPAVRAARPDVVHVHNLFPNFGYDWLESWQGPVVATLHNFRPVCANGLLFRDGETCLDCPTGRPLSAVIHACYQDSHSASLPLAIRNRRGVAGDHLLRRVEAVVLLSSRAASLMQDFGLDRSRCVVVPNGIDVPAPDQDVPLYGPWRALFIGRLSEEKGILELLRDWPADIPLDVIGSGPLEGQAKEYASPSVRFLGRLDRDEVLARLPSYGALAMPSRCLEMQATSVVEALGSGVPVVAWEGTSAATLVRDEACGAIYADGTSLRGALEAVRTGSKGMRQRSRATYEAHFTSEAWVARIESVYRTAMERPSTRRC